MSLPPPLTRLRIMSLPGRRGTVNRYFALLCDSLEKAGVRIVDVRSTSALTLGFDVIHVHFPDHAIAEEPLHRALVLGLFHALLLCIAKATGRKIVWTVHDLHPFKPRLLPLLVPYLRLFRWLVDGHVFLGPSSRAAFVKAFPRESNKPFIIVPHGPYPVSAVDAAAVTQLRSELDCSDRTVLVGYLGDIKAYKNIEALAALPSRLADGRLVRVLVAGRADPHTSTLTDAVLAAMPPGMVLRIDERISDERLDLMIRACDTVFLPYNVGTNSGMAMLVLSNGGRVLGSGLAVFSELREIYGPQWISTFTGRKTLAEAVESAVGMAATSEDREALRRQLEANSFDAAGETLKAFYHALHS